MFLSNPNVGGHSLASNHSERYLQQEAKHLNLSRLFDLDNSHIHTILTFITTTTQQDKYNDHEQTTLKDISLVNNHKKYPLTCGDT
jgi:hypothetical protein